MTSNCWVGVPNDSAETIEGGRMKAEVRMNSWTGSPNASSDMIPTTLKRVRLAWDVDGQTSSLTWPCEFEHGVTGFEVPEGAVLLTVSPVCDQDTDAAIGTYIAPAPDQRVVIIGNTISLGAVELQLQVSSCDLQPCVCQ